MIVVIGPVNLRNSGSGEVADGLACRVAISAVAAGSAAELIAKIGADPAGDALLVSLSQAGVGHVAVLRDPVHPTARRDATDEAAAEQLIADPAEAEPPAPGWIVAPEDAPSLEAADVGLALRYLTEYRVIVVIGPDDGILAEVTSAVEWAGAHPIVVVAPNGTAKIAMPADALILESAGGVDDALAFGARLGSYAAAVDAGQPPELAYATLVADPA